jgi:hypothetical protein
MSDYSGTRKTPTIKKKKKRLVADAVSPNRSQHSEFPANRENNREAYEKWRFGPKLTAGIFDLSVA